MAEEDKQEQAVAEEAPKEEIAAEGEAPAQQAAEEEAKPEKVENSYSEPKVKDGEIYLKRIKGKPRFRMIQIKKNQAELFCRFKNEWKPHPVKDPKSNKTHNLKWHLQNKWEKVEKSAIQ